MRPDLAAAAIKQAKGLEMRASGATYDQIAKVCGWNSANAAFMGVNAALKKMLKEPAEHVRSLELKRLDGMLYPFLKQAKEGNQGAVDRVLRIMARRAALLGLDAPVKIAPTNPEGDKPYDRNIDAGEARRILQALASIEASGVVGPDPSGSVAPAAEAAGGDSESGI